MQSISLVVNGVARDLVVEPDTPLVYVIRNELGLTGTKLGCGLEQCGACMVLADGTATPSCVRPVGEFAGAEIVTVEGLATGDRLNAVQEAIAAEGAAQCGYCTGGIAVTLTALFRSEPSAGVADARRALEQNICRCGSHAAVIRAVRRLVDSGNHDR